MACVNGQCHDIPIFLESGSQALAASLDKAVRDVDPYFNKLVRIMTTRCMTQAVYFGSGDLGELVATAVWVHLCGSWGAHEWRLGCTCVAVQLKRGGGLLAGLQCCLIV